MKQRIIVMVGAPGSGKSTFIKKELKANFMSVVSRDRIRFSLLKEGDKYFQHEKDVVRLYKKEIELKIKAGFPTIIVDATHLRKSSRKSILSIGKRNHCIMEAWVMDSTLEQCLKNNEKREGLEKVPPSVVEKMYFTYEEPSLKEGFDLVRKVGVINE